MFETLLVKPELLSPPTMIGVLLCVAVQATLGPLLLPTPLCLQWQRLQPRLALRADLICRH